MARQSLSYQQVVRTGLEFALVAVVAENGSQFQNDGRMALLVKNDDAASMDVTIVNPTTVDGLAVADLVVAVPAGEQRLIGPFPPNLYNTDGFVQVDYSSDTDLTVAVLRM